MHRAFGPKTDAFQKGLGKLVRRPILGPVFLRKVKKKESSCSPGQELSSWLSEVPTIGNPETHSRTTRIGAIGARTLLGRHSRG